MIFIIDDGDDNDDNKRDNQSINRKTSKGGTLAMRMMERTPQAVDFQLGSLDKLSLSFVEDYLG